MLNFYNYNKSFSHDLKNENIALFWNLSQQCCREQTNLGVSQGYKRLQRKAEPPVPHVTAFLSPPSLTVKASVTNQSPPTYSNLRVTSPCDCYIFSLKYFPKRNTESYRSSLIFSPLNLCKSFSLCHVLPPLAACFALITSVKQNKIKLFGWYVARMFDCTEEFQLQMAPLISSKWITTSDLIWSR